MSARFSSTSSMWKNITVKKAFLTSFKFIYYFLKSSHKINMKDTLCLILSVKKFSLVLPFFLKILLWHWKEPPYDFVVLGTLKHEESGRAWQFEHFRNNHYLQLVKLHFGKHINFTIQHGMTINIIINNYTTTNQVYKI